MLKNLTSSFCAWRGWYSRHLAGDFESASANVAWFTLVSRVIRSQVDSWDTLHLHLCLSCVSLRSLGGVGKRNFAPVCITFYSYPLGSKVTLHNTALKSCISVSVGMPSPKQPPCPVLRTHFPVTFSSALILSALVITSALQKTCGQMRLSSLPVSTLNAFHLSSPKDHFNIKCTRV